MRWLVLVALLTTACARKRGPNDEAPCGTVAARLFALASEDLATATVEPAMRRAVADQLPAMRDALVQSCTDGAWPASVRNCMAAAPDHVAFQACQQQLTDEQRRALDEASRGGKTPSR